MASFTIKSIPDELLERLRASAARQRRSLNAEAIYLLDRALGSMQVDPSALLAEVRAARPAPAPGLYLRDHELRAAAAAGAVTGVGRRG